MLSARSVLLSCLSLLLLVPFGGCGVSQRQSICYLVFVDQSASVSREQRLRWLSEAGKAIAQLLPGDEVMVYPIDDHTTQAAPLYMVSIPRLDDGDGLAEQVRVKHLLAKTKAESKEAIEKALSDPGQARVTDVFGALDRVRIKDRGGRKIVLVFFSDMLHSADRGRLDLERTRLDEAAFSSMISAAAEEHRWQSDTLAGATAYVILPSIDSGETQPHNNLRDLRLFYQDLFSALGCRLASFDTTLDQEGTALQ